MPEREVKILEIDKQAVVRKLEAMGAKKVYEGEVHDKLYDTPERRLSSENKMLRLRRMGESCVLAYKHITLQKNIKEAVEHEVRTPDGETLEKILYGLDFDEIRKFWKFRVSYQISGIHIDIDSVTGIPNYLEVEGRDEFEIKQMVEKLGYSMSNAKSWTTYDLLKHYQPKEWMHLLKQ